MRSFEILFEFESAAPIRFALRPTVMEHVKRRPHWGTLHAVVAENDGDKTPKMIAFFGDYRPLVTDFGD